MSKVLKNGIFTTLCFFLLLGLSWSCSDMDDYKKYIEDGEISYTGKIDSLMLFSGRNRVLIEGLFIADPKIVECRIFWNSGSDSLSVPITRTNGVDTLSVLIEGLGENVHNFEIRTYDALGNSSIPMYGIGTAYGDRYQASLINRPVISNDMGGGALTINYGSMDLTTGVFGTEVNYVDVTNMENTIIVPIDSTNVVIYDFQPGSEYTYRTLFLPDTTSIDTFYTDYVAYSPRLEVTPAPYLKNTSAPFAKATWDGSRWGTPADWIHNSAALSHNGYGALDGDVFDLESGWGQPDIINGKVYQTVNLEAGTYIFNINIKELNYEGADNNADKGYFTIASGSTLPDVDDVESSSKTIAYERINKVNGLSRSVVFTITEEVAQVSIGVQTTNDQGAGRYLKINSFELIGLTEAPYLKNASNFELAESGSRWGTPADWIHNEGALSHAGYGAYDGNTSTFDLESGWGEPDIINGKVYQTMYLAPGTYTYSIEISATNYEGADSNKDKAYFIVANGDTLPDVDDAETSTSSIVYERVNKSNGNSRSLEFTLTEVTQVSIGVETTNDQGAGRYLQIKKFTLVKQ